MAAMQFQMFCLVFIFLSMAAIQASKQKYTGKMDKEKKMDLLLNLLKKRKAGHRVRRSNCPLFVPCNDDTDCENMTNFCYNVCLQHPYKFCSFAAHPNLIFRLWYRLRKKGPD